MADKLMSETNTPAMHDAALLAALEDEDEDEDAEIEAEIRRAEDAIEDGQARWSETGSTRRQR